MATTRLITAEDLYDMEDHGGRHELIEGELRKMAPTGEEHGEISALIAGFLIWHVRQHRLGTVYAAETGFVIARDPDVVLAPDASFVRAGRLSTDRDRRRYVEAPPDLAVEVNSPSDNANDVLNKVKLYLEAGVAMIWVVDPRHKTVTEYAPGQPPKFLSVEDELDGGDVVPGFTLHVAELFG